MVLAAASSQKASFIFRLLHWLKPNKINFGKCPGGALVLYSTGFWSFSIIVFFWVHSIALTREGSCIWLWVCKERKTHQWTSHNNYIILLGQVGDSRRIGLSLFKLKWIPHFQIKYYFFYMKKLHISPFLIIASQFLFLEFLMVMFESNPLAQQNQSNLIQPDASSWYYWVVELKFFFLVLDKVEFG